MMFLLSSTNRAETAWPFRSLHPAGLWEASIPASHVGPYRLRITDGEGRVSEIERVRKF